MAFIGPYQIYTIDGGVLVARVEDWDLSATSVSNAVGTAEANAKAHADTEVAEDRGRLAAIETKNTTQDGRLDGVESKNTAQDTRLGDLESWNADLQGMADAASEKNTEQDGRLDNLPYEYVPLSRGILANGTDLNTLSGNEHVGAYALLTTSTYPNAPAITTAAVLEVQRGYGVTLAVVQRITYGTVMLWREAVNTGENSWSAWSQVETVARADATNAAQDARATLIEAKNTEQDARLDDLPNQYTPLSRGILASGTDLNTLSGNEHVGSYAMLTTSTYKNAPAITTAAVLEVQRGYGITLAVVQRITYGEVMWWREAVNTGENQWSVWAQAETVARADAANKVQDGRLTKLEAVAPKISHIALDTDGVPYYSPNSTAVHVIQDPDGVPYFITFMTAALDADGVPYFA
ncbi:hypothetical protein QFZ79_002886 [Arthrobacter sp. V4I6]|uniref:pyocin knob domain-containing protein n=1 Tax=Arthrobacter sp. V4I6 TaxID=3042281 RepID=UPI00278358EC|nr:pyocin knob domain-containing protein [Arthrobacter sp. V4I6]MDQ0854775.1 hypothetical protein [Arthrobacter sp. V4I6]